MRDHKGLNEITNVIRKDIVSMICKSKSGHPGGSLSAVEILTALYFDQMNIDPTNPKMEDRDRFVLSKGHAAPALYATLAQRGYFAKEELNNLRQLGSMLQGHPDMKKVPGVEMSTGSLGQGFSVACGMAMAAKLDNAPWNVYALLGDGEVESVMNINPIEDKFKTFGWNVITIDGHDFDQIFAALDMAKDTVDKPTMIIAKTIKGKGVSFMENQASWHGSAPSEEQLEQALSELGGAFHE